MPPTLETEPRDTYVKGTAPLPHLPCLHRIACPENGGIWRGEPGKEVRVSLSFCPLGGMFSRRPSERLGGRPSPPPLATAPSVLAHAARHRRGGAAPASLRVAGCRPKRTASLWGPDSAKIARAPGRSHKLITSARGWSDYERSLCASNLWIFGTVHTALLLRFEKKIPPRTLCAGL